MEMTGYRLLTDYKPLIDYKPLDVASLRPRGPSPKGARKLRKILMGDLI